MSDIKTLKSFFSEVSEEHDYLFIELETTPNFMLILKKTIKFEINRGQAKYLIIKITHVQNIKLLSPMIIVGLHLDAMNSGSEKRRAQAEQIMMDLVEEERAFNTNNSLIIGDFNANPFDIVLLGHNYFNSVLFRELIENNEFVKWNCRCYRRFYNPSFDYLSEKNKQYGSFYYDDPNYPLYWNCLDQVLVRKTLIESLKNVEYIKQVGSTFLLTTKGKINKNKLSDHLPLFVRIDL